MLNVRVFLTKEKKVIFSYYNNFFLKYYSRSKNKIFSTINKSITLKDGCQSRKYNYNNKIIYE
jgi:hypothetical protein